MYQAESSIRTPYATKPTAVTRAAARRITANRLTDFRFNGTTSSKKVGRGGPYLLARLQRDFENGQRRENFAQQYVDGKFKSVRKADSRLSTIAR